MSNFCPVLPFQIRIGQFQDFNKEFLTWNFRERVESSGPAIAENHNILEVVSKPQIRFEGKASRF